MTGLLSPAEIQAIAGRLETLQAHVRRVQTLTASLDGEGAELSWAMSTPFDLFHNHEGNAKRGEKTSYYGEIVTHTFQQP